MKESLSVAGSAMRQVTLLLIAPLRNLDLKSLLLGGRMLQMIITLCAKTLPLGMVTLLWSLKWLTCLLSQRALLRRWCPPLFQPWLWWVWMLLLVLLGARTLFLLLPSPLFWTFLLVQWVASLLRALLGGLLFYWFPLGVMLHQGIGLLRQPRWRMVGLRFLMERGGLYPLVGIDVDSELEENFYDVDSSVHSYRGLGNSFNSSKMEESANADPLSQTLSDPCIVTDADRKFDAETSMVSELPRECDCNIQNDEPNEQKEIGAHRDGNSGRQYFYYECPLLEETGPWIPVSIPPMSASDHEEWYRDQGVHGGYFPEDDVGWQYSNQELTLWTVISEMLAVISAKASSFAGAKCRSSISPFANHMPKRILEQAWREMAQTLIDTSFNNIKDILEAEPTKWLADSAASACMLCNSQFHPIMRRRHHCRFCGLIFCGVCSRGRSLLPVKFRTNDPQRVCDVCWVRLESAQGLLERQVSHAAQEAIHDVTDLSTLRSWVNIPWGQSMENEIYKATNTLRGFVKIGYLRPERSIPDAVLRGAKGLALLTVVKVGMMVTYKVGTGLVIARKEDGSWSPPSAISSIGVGWGAQAGGEVTDFVIVLRTEEAVKTFGGNIHFSIGAGLNAAAGPIGRVIEADLRAGDGGSAACYTYSCSKGAFVGCSLEGNIVKTRTSTNVQFYGNLSIKPCDILFGSIPKPTAAAPLYNALSELFDKREIS